MTVLFAISAALAAPFIYDDGAVRCVLLHDEPDGVHEQALAAWAPRGTRADGEALEDCEPVVPRRVDCPEGLGLALPFAAPITDLDMGDGVRAARMSGEWLHVRGEGDLAVSLEGAPPVLIRVVQVEGEPAPVRPGTIVDLGFVPDYLDGTAQVVRVGQAVMVTGEGNVFVQQAGQAPVAYALAPDSSDPQIVLKPGKSRLVTVDDLVEEVVVGNPLVAGAVIRGQRVKVMATAAGETRMGLVLSSGQVLPVRVIVR